MPYAYSPDEPVVHGTRKAYECAKCRCDACRAFNTQRCLQYKEARGRAHSKWAAANPEYRVAYEKVYRQTVNGKAARRRSHHKRRRGIEYTPAAQEYIKILLRDPCAYCGLSTGITIDHIVPVAEGGSSDWANLTAACALCNSQKRTRSILDFLLTHKD